MRRSLSGKLEFIMNIFKTSIILTAFVAMTITTHAQSWLTSGLVAYFPFSGNANDASGNANHGTINNVTLAPTGLGRMNQVAVLTGGYDQWIEVPHSASLNTATVCISLWFNNNRSDNSDVRFLCGKAYGQLEIHIGGQPANTLSGVRFIPGNGSLLDTTSGTTAQEWTHLVCIAGPGSDGGKIYLNGQPASISVSGNASASIGFSNDRFALGMRGGNSGWPHFDGRIDNVRIYNRALSASEVTQLYAIESAPPLAIRKAVYLDSASLVVGKIYQLQVSDDLNTWTNRGPSFTATNTYWRDADYFDVDDWNRLFFRLLNQEPP